MGFISQNRLKVTSQKMELDCTMEIVVSPEKSEAYYLRFETYGGR